MRASGKISAGKIAAPRLAITAIGRGVMIWRGEGDVKEPERRDGGATHAGVQFREAGS